VERLADPIGAGDALLAYASLSLFATGNIVLASILGSVAAAVACEHQGNEPVTPAQADEKINRLEKRSHFE
jgi:sugar/nucleoside kinase (ribokinase family)